jgi:hypothetical protein
LSTPRTIALRATAQRETPDLRAIPSAGREGAPPAPFRRDRIAPVLTFTVNRFRVR